MVRFVSSEFWVYSSHVCAIPQRHPVCARSGSRSAACRSAPRSAQSPGPPKHICEFARLKIMDLRVGGDDVQIHRGVVARVAATPTAGVDAVDLMSDTPRERKRDTIVLLGKRLTRKLMIFREEPLERIWETTRIHRF